jgi:hypothetical protein
MTAELSGIDERLSRCQSMLVSNMGQCQSITTVFIKRDEGGVGLSFSFWHDTCSSLRYQQKWFEELLKLLNTGEEAQLSVPGTPEGYELQPQRTYSRMSSIYFISNQTTLYLPGALESVSAAAIVPSFSSLMSSLMASCTTTSVSPSTKMYNFGLSLGPGSFPAA